jgi:hypothetical protein
MPEEEETLLMDCPKCGIKITVAVRDCREGTHTRCPICAEDICFHFSDQELKELAEKMKRQQDRELYKQFPMTFGEL